MNKENDKGKIYSSIGETENNRPSGANMCKL